MRITFRFNVLAWVFASLVCARAHAAAPVDDPSSDDPEVEKRLLQLPEGFDIQLFASEPLLKRPVTMNFDPSGRLWVLCIPRYPQILPGQEPIDYIAVLEDPKGVGHADSSHIFVTGLRVPTGMIPGDGGVYVGEGDLLLHFSDTTGSGKADRRRIIFSGFGTQDTHHTLDTFRWGPDGFLYFNQGFYINSSVETPYGLRQRFGGAVWQLRTDSLALEIYDRSIYQNNTWGLIFDNWGQPIISSPWPANINLVLPDSPLNHSDDLELIPPLSMTKLGGERHSGLELITGRHFPADWQNNLVSGGFNSQKVYRFAIQDDGQRLSLKELAPLIVSHHSKFRPIDMKMGPDGALYVLDWYNIIIQHNQVNFRDPRRDHEHGRIWRITYRGSPLVPNPHLTELTTPQVLDHLKDPEQWTRTQAKRVLAERDPKEVLAALGPWIAGIQGNDPDAEHALLEALWTYQTLNVVEPALLSRLMRAGDPHVRAAATTVLGYWQDRISNPTDLLAVQADDENIRVRLNAVLAAQRVPSAGAIEAALHALDHPLDSYVTFELHRAALVLKQYWYPAFESRQLDFNGSAGHLSFALESVHATDAIPRLLDLLKNGKIARESQVDLLTTVAALGNAQQQNVVLDAAVAPEPFTIHERTRLLDALVQAARSRDVHPDGDPARIASLLPTGDELSLAALHAVGAWKLEALRPQLNQITENAGTIPAQRQAAIAALVDLGGPPSIQQLTQLADPSHPYGVRVDAIAGLTNLDLKPAGILASHLLHDPIATGGDPAPVFAAFVRRTGGADVLAKSLKKEKPDPDAARIGIQQMYAAGISAPALAEALRLENEATDRQSLFTPAEQQRLVHLAQTQGDPVRGEKIFRGSIGCMQCHAIAGAGGNVAPDLAAIGTTAQPDFLVEHIIKPGKSIKDGYAAMEVTTKTGDSYTGIRLSDTVAELVLRDASHDEIIIPKASIKKQRAIGTLMPTGLADGLTDNELADLVRFLSELGKPGPFDAGHAPVVRQWRAAASVPDGTSGGEARITWARAFSNVAGELPLQEVGIGPRQTMAIVRCGLNVSVAGKVGLALNDVSGLRLSVDGREAPAQTAVELDLSAGPHTLEFLINRAVRSAPTLRCELTDVAHSSAKAQWTANR